MNFYIEPAGDELMEIKQSIIFQAPRTIMVEESPVIKPGPEEVLVRTLFSAISPGTEMLFYRGLVPETMPVDDTIEALAREFSYPISYGYALVGTVIGVGAQVDREWVGRLVFVFAPHQSHIVSRVENLLIVPEELSAQNAVLLPFMETAVSFLMDGLPMIGERAVVFGQGIIGLLVTALLAAYPMADLVTIDPFPLRRDWSRRLGAYRVLDPAEPELAQQLTSILRGDIMYHGADLVFELSGNPQALEQAIACAGFDGRIVVGSWYGRQTAHLDLGSHFHRSQINIISSQVSHIAPRWRGRFSKARRLQVAWDMLARLQPQSLITHTFPVAEAVQAYRLLDEAPESTVQVILDYRTHIPVT